MYFVNYPKSIENHSPQLLVTTDEETHLLYHSNEWSPITYQNGNCQGYELKNILRDYSDGYGLIFEIASFENYSIPAVMEKVSTYIFDLGINNCLIVPKDVAIFYRKEIIDSMALAYIMTLTLEDATLIQTASNGNVRSLKNEHYRRLCKVLGNTA